MEVGIAGSYGVCMTMRTASTMTLPGASSIAAADSNHGRMCAAAGRRAVEMVWKALTPAKIQTEAAFRDAIVVAMAIGCSTNAVIHLLAMGRRAGHATGLDDFDAAGRKVPAIANIRPSGDKYLMKDFSYAGGLLGMMTRLRQFLDLTQVNASGPTWDESLEGAEVYNEDVIRALDRAIYREGALAVLRGNLAPDGCVVKPSAAASHLLRHSGPALVFGDYPALKASIDRDDLDVTENHVLVRRNAGPLGGVCISDPRMSGTSYGACILHVAPEAYVGGPLALVKTGDIISIDVPARSIRLEVPDEELFRRRAALTRPVPRYERG